MSQNVQFFENKLSGELTIVDVSMLAISTEVVNKFVNNILIKYKSIVTGFQPKSVSNISSFLMKSINANNVLSNIHSIILSSNNTSRILSNPPSAPKKFLKQINLSKRNTSSYIYKLVKHYRLIAINNAIIASGLVNFVFIIVINELRTYRKALCFLYSTKQKDTIKLEYFQLLKTGIFEYVNKLPAGKRAAENKIVFKKKMNSYSKYVKFKVYYY